LSNCAIVIQHVLTTILHHRAVFMNRVFLGMAFASLLLIPFLGRKLLPGGGFRADQAAHPRDPTGSARGRQPRDWVDHIEAAVRDTIASKQITSVVDKRRVCPVFGQSTLTYGKLGHHRQQ